MALKFEITKKPKSNSEGVLLELGEIQAYLSETLMQKSSKPCEEMIPFPKNFDISLIQMGNKEVETLFAMATKQLKLSYPKDLISSDKKQMFKINLPVMAVPLW